MIPNAHAIVRCEQGCDAVEYCGGGCAALDADPTCVDCAITRAGRGHLLCGDADAGTCLGPNLLWRCGEDPIEPGRVECRFREQVFCGGGCENGACTACGSSPYCPAGTACEDPSGVCVPICGDGACVAQESAWSCGADCARCGDGVCSTNEDPAACALDCHCDGVCDPLDSAINCPVDFARCVCGDGVCNAWEAPFPGVVEPGCAADCAAVTCGDGRCEGREVLRAPVLGESGWCAADCPKCDDSGVCGLSVCGDGTCDAPETGLTCTQDCRCGDGVCDNQEYTLTCFEDCPTCGDSRCDDTEDSRTCARDCTCGDGQCSTGESNLTCAEDCRCGDGICDPDETLLGGRTPCGEDCQ